MDAWSLEQLHVLGVKIGDLVYDTYLRRTGLPTIDFDGSDYAAILLECIGYCVYWDEYYQKHNVTAVCVSHCVYQHGIPARFALAHHVDVFQATVQHLYRVTEEFPHAYTDFFLYHREFEALDAQEQEAGLALARERLERRFAGEVGVDMPYSTASAYSERTAPTDPVLRPSDRTKVLVAVHDFYDSPHSFGDNLYPDFYIWLRRLGELSRQVDYDWYIKTHPDFRGDGPAVLAQFVEEFPNFTILPATTSHLDIVRDGVDVALTVYGTIAMEYAAMGRAVVNASRFNPHVGYDFSLTPENRDDYEQVILHLDELTLSPTVEDVLEYYYMHLIYPLPNWVFSDFHAFLNRCGGYYGAMTDAAYDAYIDDFDIERDRITRTALRRFIASGDIRLDRRHYAE